ncbi:MAG TPA: hypothetical protein VFB19_18745 [Mycobacterium sp.]|nr:hypothetical protein [Mycobacterium sp.]
MTWRSPNGLVVRKPLQRRTKLRARSPKRAADMRAYGREVEAFLAEPEHATCEFPLGCASRSTAVHHRRGRFGRRLRDQRWWAGTCAFHNAYAEDHTGEALACGWLLRIEGVR